MLNHQKVSKYYVHGCSIRFKVNHGKNVFEEKPANYTNLSEIRKYEITFTQHSHDYDLCNAEKLFDDFFLNVKNKLEDLAMTFSLNVAFL